MHIHEYSLNRTFMVTNQEKYAGCCICYILNYYLGYLRLLFSWNEYADYLARYAEPNKIVGRKHNNSAASWQIQQNGMCAQRKISVGIRPVWSEFSLSAWRKLGSLTTHWAHSEDSDQTGRVPRLIWDFAGRTCHFVGFATAHIK